MISRNDIHKFTSTHRILLRTNEFICLRPHLKLSGYVSNYNITFPTEAIMPAGFTIMPCGCSTLSIELDSCDISVFLEGPSIRPSPAGTRTNQLRLLVTIEFKPAGLYAITGIPQHELANTSVSLEMVHPKLSKSVREATEAAASVNELAASLDQLLLDNINDAYPPELIITLQSIINHSGDINIKSLSDHIHYSERQLNRYFNQYVGISAKSFSRLIRINNTFHLFNRPENSLTFISDVMGFHDLSHFIRDFKSVCGIAPQDYRNNMSDFYINPTKF